MVDDGSHKRQRRVMVGALPKGQKYEKSYAHRGVVDRLVCLAQSGVIVTASRDGHVKLWKKMKVGIEFVKAFHAHVGALSCLAADGFYAVSSGLEDCAVKVYDCKALDMVKIVRLKPFVPRCVSLAGGALSLPKVLVGGEDGTIRVYDDDYVAFSFGSKPVLCSCYAANSFGVSVDAGGFVEYWTLDGAHPENVQFEHKVETDLYALAKAKATPVSLELSRSAFSIACSDSKVRVFSLYAGKLILEIDAEARDEVWNAPFFDESRILVGKGSGGGIRVVDLESRRESSIASKDEECYLWLSSLSSYVSTDSQLEVNAKESFTGEGKDEEDDPVVFASALNRKRFYLVTNRDGKEEDRDVKNEPPDRAAQRNLAAAAAAQRVAAEEVTMRTTMGDVTLKLFPKETPKTCENFCTHAKNGYYDNLIFHRVIKGFMLQTGDPKGDGTGGESIWGREFEDEIVDTLKHDRPFVLSMANAGPRTNGSQFFITTIPTPWLDGKHTVFGRVTKGADTCTAIENVKTDRFDKPKTDVKIISIDF